MSSCHHQVKHEADCRPVSMTFSSKDDRKLPIACMTAWAADTGESAGGCLRRKQSLSADLVGAQLAAILEVWDCESGHLPSFWQGELAALPVQVNMLLQGATSTNIKQCIATLESITAVMSLAGCQSTRHNNTSSAWSIQIGSVGQRRCLGHHALF